MFAFLHCLMTLEEFKVLRSLSKLSRPLQALWYDAQGDWHRAHELAQNAGSSEGDWVHAYLHRKEGDEGNARYWYNQAGRVKSSATLQEEWVEIALELLK